VGIGLLVVLVVGGTWFGWRAWRGVPVSLTVDGAPILNAEQVLAQADPMFRELARIDGATLPGGAACWFAPPPKDAVRADQPRVACGPVLLGISGDKQRWVVGTPSYSATTTGGSRGSTGTFGAFDGVEELRPALLARPDGKHPPDGEPGLGAAGVRTVNGRIIVDAAQVVQSADRGFAAAASKSGAAVGPDSRCYLGVRDETRSGVTIAVSDGNLWCGPVLRTDSAANATWASFPLALKLGQSIVEATAGDPSISEVTSTKTLPAGMRAYRADGLRPPDGAGGLQVPDSDPVKAGTIAILDELPSTVGAPAPSLMVPPDGRLVTPSVTVQLTGIGRLPKVGSGTDAFVAPKGEGLAVATFQITREAGAPSGNGTATLIVDGVRIAVRDWSSVKDGGALVASVPIGSRDIVLEVLSQGRAQGISLVTGQRMPGGPGFPPGHRGRLEAGHPLLRRVRGEGGHDLARADAGRDDRPRHCNRLGGQLEQRPETTVRRPRSRVEGHRDAGGCRDLRDGRRSAPGRRPVRDRALLGANLMAPEASDQTTDRTSPGSPTRLQVAASGAVFLASGASLVGYILTGAPMALVLGVLVLLGAMVVGATFWGQTERRRQWLTCVQVGIPAGLIATFCYDGSRYLLVQVAGFTASPFAAFPLFGQALIGSGAGVGPRTLIGVGFHLLNGIAFGVAYTVWFGKRPFYVGIPFALVLEAFMLALYPGWMDMRTIAEFTQMSLVGHIVYGAVLGFLAHRWLRRATARRGGDSGRMAGPRSST